MWKAGWRLAIPKTMDYFETLGEDFEAFMNEYDVERRLKLVFEDLLEGTELSGKWILEVGCGTGRFSEEIVHRGGQLTAVDIGPRLVKEVCGRLGCQGEAADACVLPFAEESFDVVISSECVEHTGNPLVALREMCRVCRRGGCVCVTTPNRLWYPALWVSEKLKIRKFEGRESWIWPGQARKLMEETGMKEIRFSGCHCWPFQLGWTKPVLRRLDGWGRSLYPVMINFGVIGRKG